MLVIVCNSLVLNAKTLKLHYFAMKQEFFAQEALPQERSGIKIFLKYSKGQPHSQTPLPSFYRTFAVIAMVSISTVPRINDFSNG